MNFKQDVIDTYQAISSHLRKTPLIYSEYFSDKARRNIFFKIESLQYTGSFKLRGALNKISSLPATERKKTLITASGGNHGLGVCYAARQFAMQAVVYLPTSTPRLKIDKIKNLGGEVILFGSSWDEANAQAQSEAEKKDMIYVHPFSDEEVICGQATIGYEILKENPDIDLIVCSIGGGGLISGISRYTKSIKTNIKIWGAETRGAESMYLSIKEKKLIELERINSIAESLGAKKVTEKTFRYVQDYVDSLFVVSDEDAVKAMIAILQHEKLLVEPAASCSLCAVMQHAPDTKENCNICIILCGGNFPLEKMATYLK